MYSPNLNGAPLYMFMDFDDQKERRSDPSTVEIKAHNPIQRNN